MTDALPISAYLTKTDLIAEALRRRVLSGELAAGERLVLRVIADEFACSDIPVREAMRTLAAEGLVTIAPHEGARVSPFDARLLVEWTEARALLEPEATVLAGRQMSEEDVAKLRVLAERMSAVADGSGAGYGALNRQFHAIILDRCPNRTIASIIGELWNNAERGKAVYRLFDGHVETSLAHHAEIIRCIEAKDFVGLHSIAEEHCAHGLAAVRRLCSETAPNSADISNNARKTSRRSRNSSR